MSFYRFSPIKSEYELGDAISHIHKESYRLCKNTFGEYLPNSGNIGVFCHYQEEYEYLTSLRKSLTEASDNFNQKYFRLFKPINIPAQGDVPETVYGYMYIRQPDPYRHHVGDVDFYLPEEEYSELKNKYEKGDHLPDSRLFPSPHLEMIELFHPDSDVLAYVSTSKMTDLVKSTKSNA